MTPGGIIYYYATFSSLTHYTPRDYLFFLKGKKKSLPPAVKQQVETLNQQVETLNHLFFE